MPTSLLGAPLAGFLLLGTGAVLLSAGLARRYVTPAGDDPAGYLASLEHGPDGEDTDEFRQLLAQPFLGRVVGPVAGTVLGVCGGLLPRNHRERVQAQLLHAGLAGRYRAEEIISLQVLAGLAAVAAAIALAALGVLEGNVGILAVVTLPLLGVQAPRSWLGRAVQQRTDAIRRDLPDTLDLLAISVEAGLGFEAALGVVCQNFESPLAEEFGRTLREMELGLPRREALQNLKRRTEVPELSNFVLALMQADALGMPMGRVLKTSAEEMRTRRQQWAREKAAKLPVKILFPLVLFIFPAIFVVLLGPAASDIGGAFG